MHHLSLEPSPLERPKFGMISQIPIDYMHNCLLGNMKKLLLVWTEGAKPQKLSIRQRDSITDRLISFRPRVPNNFVRKCRGLGELRHWKVTEYRLLLLYVGPVALRKILDNEKYQHFLLFHSAIYILVSDCSKNIEWIDFAKKLLDKFVHNIPVLYYKELMVYNMHTLLHLTDDVKIHGALDSYSTFEFENYMQNIKRMLRSNSSHIKQVVHRALEMDNFVPFNVAINTKTQQFSHKVGDNCFQTYDGKICTIVERNEGSLTVQYFTIQKDVKLNPFPSSHIGIWQVENLGRPLQLNSDSLKRKCFLLPIKNTKFLCIPLCNSSL